MAKHNQEHRTAAKPQHETKHPEPWEKDLNPNRMQGQNIATHKVRDHNARTAADVKELTRKLPEFRDDELRDIPIVPAGTRLEQGAVYLDLRNPAEGPIRATAAAVAGEENHFVPKLELPYATWNRLIAALCPDCPEPGAKQKTKQASEREAQNAGVSEELIDKASADSFPTSDPPAWTTGRDEKTDPERNQTDPKRNPS